MTIDGGGALSDQFNRRNLFSRREQPAFSIAVSCERALSRLRQNSASVLMTCGSAGSKAAIVNTAPNCHTVLSIM